MAALDELNRLFLSLDSPWSDSIECVTLRIIECKAISEAFTDASITTQEHLSAVFYDPKECRSNGLLLRDCWDVNKLQQLIHERSGLDQPKIKKRFQDVQTEEAFNALDQYFKDIETHERSLLSVLRANQTPEKDSFAKVLITHLFGPLCHGNCYLGNHIPTSSLCSCGCKLSVKKGNTGLGHLSTWHGFVDMFLQETIPVSVVTEIDDQLAEEIDSSPESYIEQDTVTTSSQVTSTESLSERREIIETGSEGPLASRSITKAGAYNMKSKCNFCEQLIAQTITNGFAQVNQNEELSGLPIPAFGCTSERLLVYAYDCENDILLKRYHDMDLFNNDGKINASTIVFVWLHLNFRLFIKSDIFKPYLLKSQFLEKRWMEKFYKKAKSGLHGFPRPNSPKLFVTINPI